MPRPAPEVLRDVLDLPEKEQLDVVSEVLAHIDGPRDAAWEEAWLTELRRRHQDRALSLTPEQEWPQVEKRLLARFSR